MDYEEELSFSDQEHDLSPEQAVLPYDQEDWEFNNETNENPSLPDNEEYGQGVIMQPFSDQQLLAYYNNPLLEHNNVYTDRFIDNSAEYNKTFHNLLTQYSQSVKNLNQLREDYDNYCDQMNKTTEKVFNIGQGQINAVAYCKDQRKVTTIHTFKTCSLNNNAISELRLNFNDIIRVGVDDLTMANYHLLLSKLECEQFLSEATMELSTNLINLKENQEPNSSSLLIQILDESFDCIRQCINSLFHFIRKDNCNDLNKKYKSILQTWTSQLTNTLYYNSHREALRNEEMFILNHIIRCPPGIFSWAPSLVQICCPSLEFDFWKYKPLLDHVIYMLYLILHPPKSRDKFLSAFKQAEMVVPVHRQSSVEEDKSWTFLKENGEEVSERLLNPWHVLPLESDMVSLYCQIPFENLLAHILSLKLDVNSSKYLYVFDCDTSDSMLQTFACCDLLCDILGDALASLGAPQFKQLVRRIAQTIRNVVLLVAEHWKKFKKENENSKTHRHSMLRLQTEFDAFVRRCVERLLYVARLGVYQFLADLPFDTISQRAAEIIYVLMNVPPGSRAEVDQLSRTLYSTQEYMEFLQDSDTKLAFEEQLSSMPENEVVYLITAFSNLAQARPHTEKHLINVIATDVYSVSFLYASTKDICSKMGKELICTIATVHPFVMSTLLQFVNTLEITNNALSSLTDLPFSCWKINQADIHLLKSWLIKYPLGSCQNKFSQIALLNLNWDLNENGDELFLDHSLHKEIAIALVEVSICEDEEKRQAGMIGKGMDQMSRVASAIKWTLTLEESFHSWIWDILSRLKLHNEQLPCSIQFEVTDLNDSAVLLQAVRMNLSIGYYIALAVTNLGHSMNDFLQNGSQILLSLSQSPHKMAALRSILFLLPMFVKAEVDLSMNNSFLLSLNSVLRTSASILQGITSRITDNAEKTQQYLKLVCGAIQIAIDKDSEYTRTLIIYWLKLLLSLQSWHTDPNICGVLNYLLMLAFYTGIDCVDEIRGLVYQQTTEVLLGQKADLNGPPQHQNKSMISSIWGMLSNSSHNMAPSFYSEVLAHAPYLSYFILDAETRYEDDSKLWDSLISFLQSHNIDVALKKAAAANKLTYTPALQQISIYRWANQILYVDFDHPIFVLFCQQFFLRFIYLQNGANSIGRKFFALNQTMQVLDKLIEKFTVSVNTTKLSKNVEKLQSIEKLCQVFIKWLEEPKLHDNNLYVPSLTSHFKPELLADVRAYKQRVWSEYVDMTCIYEKVMEARDEYSKSRKRGKRSGVPTHSSSMALSMTTCQRITQLLRQFESPQNLEMVVELTGPVSKADFGTLTNLPAVREVLDENLKSMDSYASDFMVFKSKLETMNRNYVELIPDLYSMQEASKWVNIECQSAFSSSHKCAGPAHVELKFKEKTLIDEVAQLLKLNRTSYDEQMQMIISDDAVMEICYNSLYLKSVVEALIANSQDPKFRSDARDGIYKTGAELFYIIADVHCSNQWKCPPSQHILSLCLDLIGQAFIAGQSDQAVRLLNKMLEYPKVAGLLSSHFSPAKACICDQSRKSDKCAFVEMYNKVVDAVDQEQLVYSADVLFVLITKFDFETWLTKHTALKIDRIKVLRAIIKGLCIHMKPISNSFSDNTITSPLPNSPMSISSQITFSNFAVQEIFTSHLCILVSHSVEEIFFESLCLLLEKSKDHSIDATAWEALISSAFTTSDRDMSKALVVDEQKPLISYDTSLKSIQYMAVFFSDLRATLISDDKPINLYDSWNVYIQAIAHVLHCLCITLIQHHFVGKRSENELSITYVLNEFILPVYYAWLKTERSVRDDHTIWPWSEETQHYADHMLLSFSSVLNHICKFNLDNTSDYKSFLSCVWKYYGNNILGDGKLPCPSFICSSFQTAIHSLSWDIFLPDFMDLDLMVRLAERSSLNTIHFMCFLFPQVNWEEIIDRINQSNNTMDSIEYTQSVVCRFLHVLLILASQPNRLVSYPELTRLVSRAKSFPFQCITYNQFDYILNVLSEHYSADCLVESVTEDSKTHTKILSDARYLIIELLQIICKFKKHSPEDPTSVEDNGIGHNTDAEIWLKRQSLLQSFGNIIRKTYIKQTKTNALNSLVAEFISNLFETVILTLNTEDIGSEKDTGCIFVMFNEIWNYIETFPQHLQTIAVNALIQSIRKCKNSSNNSQIVISDTAFVCLFQSSCNVVTSAAYFSLIVEAMLEICMVSISDFLKKSEADDAALLSPVKTWKTLIPSLKDIKSNKLQVFESSVEKNHYLTIYALCVNMFSISDMDNFDEVSREKAFDAVLSIVQWMSAITPTSNNEIKLILWFDFFLHVCVYLLKLTADNSDSNINIFSVTDSLASILPTLETWSIDKIKTGLLGSIGLGRSSALSTQFRITTRALVVFVKLHLARLLPNDEAQSTSALEYKNAFLQLAINKNYTEFSAQMTEICRHFGDNLLKIQNYQTLLETLLKTLFPNHQYFIVLLRQ